MTIRLLHLDGLVVDRERRMIHRGDVCASFRQAPVMWAMIQSLLLRGPLGKPQLADAMWGNDADGGPLWIRNEIDVLICHARKRLTLVGLRIERTRYGQGVPFHIVRDVGPLAIDLTAPPGTWRHKRLMDRQTAE